MRFACTLYPWRQFDDLDAMVEFVRRAEGLGFDTATIPEHTAFPKAHEATLGQLWWDPLVIATHLAAHTRLRLLFTVLVLPQHQPLRLAKALATLDHVSKGRVDVGVGVGWLREEAEMVGCAWENRGARTEEYLRAMKALWTSDPASFSGEHVSFADASFFPKPLQSPHPPLYIGGTWRRSAIRAAALGDGWVPMGPSPDDLRRGIALLRSELERRERPTAGFPIVARMPWWPYDEEVLAHYREVGSSVSGYFNGDADAALQYIHELEALGVTDMVVQLPNGARALDELDRFGHEVIARARPARREVLAQ